VFSPSIYLALANTSPGYQGEIQLTDAIRLMLENGEKVYGVRLPSNERRYDVGNFKSYFEAFVEFALHDPDYGPGLKEYLKERFREDL
jgi:UTP--glucose-1-phosphate uridylyltransferase